MARTQENYLRRSTYKMTDKEALHFAQCQAIGASMTMRIIDNGKVRCMTDEEMKEYALSIYASIRYFNARDPRHAEEMRYRAVCQNEAELHQLAESKMQEKIKVCVI